LTEFSRLNYIVERSKYYTVICQELKGEGMNYRLPAGKSVKIITPLAFLMPLALLIWFYILDITLVGILISIPLFIVFSVVYAYTPKEVVLEDEQLVIKKVFGKVSISYSKIEEISYFKKLSWKTIRLFGSGGLFGWFGIFHVPGIGEVWIYARRTRDFVFIKADRKYLISPENPQMFIAALKEKLKSRNFRHNFK